MPFARFKIQTKNMAILAHSTIPNKKPTVWFYKIFNLNSMGIFIFLSVLVFFEIELNLLEKMGGSFLKWHNHERQKLGRMWDLKEKSVVAMGQLNELLIEKEKKREKIKDIDSFHELFDLLETDRLISLTKNQFIRIYQDLPPIISNKIIGSDDLINYFHRSDWDKTFIFKKVNNFEIIMVDGNYGVINSILISEKNSKYLANFKKTMHTSLENIEALSSRIYDVREFMEALYKMSQEERNKVIYSPSEFLGWGNRLKRIGISEISENNLVQIGFEIHSSDNKKVVIIYVDDYLIYNLIQHLTGIENSTSNSIDEL